MKYFRVKVKIIAGKASRKNTEHEFCVEAESELDARSFLSETQKHLYLTQIKAV